MTFARFGRSSPPKAGQRSPQLSQAQAIMRRLALDAVQSSHSRRNYAKALDDLFAISARRSIMGLDTFLVADVAIKIADEHLVDLSERKVR
jgi:Golgi nucleoside diphosphatase